MSQPLVHSWFVRSDGLKLAYRTCEGTGPTLVFLPGYMSDMAGSKATAVFDWAVAHGRSCLLLDYAGCGESEGVFADQTLTGWRDDALAMVDALVKGPVVLIGSSMGGWLMLLVGLALSGRLHGLIGIAPAPDFTRWGFTDAQKAVVRDEGVLFQPNPYGSEPTPTWRKLFDDGVGHELLDGEIAIECPVRILQGQCDSDVPWKLSLKLAGALRSNDVRVTLIKDGDHRLSREADVALLIDAVMELAAQ